MVGTLRRPPLALLLPGLDSVKEEFYSWENVFLKRGLATFSLDGPGQGATVKDVSDAGDFIAAEGLTACNDLLHGYGMGYLPPVVRTRATAHKDQAPEDFIFQKNMAVVVQPNVVDPDSGAGLQLGNLLIVGESGAESLQKLPMACAAK